MLAQLYDEMCRKDWAERAARGDVDFDVNLVCLACDQEMLDRARIAYDSTNSSKAHKEPTAAGSSAGLRRPKQGSTPKGSGTSHAVSSFDVLAFAFVFR